MMTSYLKHEHRLVLLATVLALFVVLALSACAISPEAKLKHGYETISTAARTTTILLDRKVIGSAEAERVLVLSQTGKAALDDGTAKLKVCRARQQSDPTLKCDAAFSTINLGSGVLLELEAYLEGLEGATK